MKKILITGTNSYIGTSFEKWCLRYPGEYLINTVDMKNDLWKEISFSEYDTVFHVAGIVHKQETRNNVKLYYEINRDLSFEVAWKSKNDGVGQFIYLSSTSVYGVETGVINKDTKLEPKTNYGKSKLQAENLLRQLIDESFKLAIIRPPMVYGKGCKGNYDKLRKVALNIFFFPNTINERSMIYIDNLCEFIRLLVDDFADGLFFPQNEEYVCTSDMVKTLTEVHKKKVYMIKTFNPFLKLIKMRTLDKLFGNLVYEKNLSKYEKQYCIYNFRDSILETES